MISSDAFTNSKMFENHFVNKTAQTKIKTVVVSLPRVSLGTISPYPINNYNKINFRR
jgi:hypothetical protein